jgi:Family of unknown function (DUF6221)
MTGELPTAALTAWLRLQIDEDERIAHYARASEFSPDGGGWHIIDALNGDKSIEDEASMGIAHRLDLGSAAHIALHDPARALAECAAKRNILDHNAEIHRIIDEEVGDHARPSYVLAAGASDRVVMFMAAVYSGRDGYREEWKP